MPQVSDTMDRQSEGKDLPKIYLLSFIIPVCFFYPIRQYKHCVLPTANNVLPTALLKTN